VSEQGELWAPFDWRLALCPGQFRNDWIKAAVNAESPALLKAMMQDSDSRSYLPFARLLRCQFGPVRQGDGDQVVHDRSRGTRVMGRWGGSHADRLVCQVACAAEPALLRKKPSEEDFMRRPYRFCR
jgi:hypothetical protein